VYTVSASGMTNTKTATVTVALPETYLTNPVAEGCNGWEVVAQTVENGAMTVVLIHENANGEGDLFTVTAGLTGERGEGTVTVTDAVFSYILGAEECFAETVLTDATVTTEFAGNPYDLNRDGVVDLLDVTRAQRYYGSDAYPEADFNGTDGVDISDLITILNNFTNEF
jgi:hypothetical protein